MAATVSSGTNVACAIAGIPPYIRTYAKRNNNDNIIKLKLSNRKIIAGNPPMLEACRVYMQSTMIFNGCPVEVIPSATASESNSSASMPCLTGVFSHQRLDGTNNVTINWGFTYHDENGIERQYEYDLNNPAMIPSFTTFYYEDFGESESVNGNAETVYDMDDNVSISTESKFVFILDNYTIIVCSTVSGASCIVTTDTRN